MGDRLMDDVDRELAIMLILSSFGDLREQVGLCNVNLLRRNVVDRGSKILECGGLTPL